MLSNKEMKSILEFLFHYRIVTCSVFSIIFYFCVWEAIAATSKIIGLRFAEVIAAALIVLTIALYFELNRNRWQKWALFICAFCTLLSLICVLSLINWHTGIKFLLLFTGIYSTCELENQLFKVKVAENERRPPIDTLNRSYMYAGVYSWIRTVSKVSGEGQALAIMGDWGAGKTHLRRYLECRLSKKHDNAVEDDVRLEHSDQMYQGPYVVGEVNLWRMHNFEEAWTNIEKELLRIVGEKERLRRINSLPIVAHALKHFLHVDTEVIQAVKELVYNQDGSSCVSSVNVLSDRLTEMGVHAVIFFDDVERADAKIIEYLLPLIHRLKKIKRLIVVCNIAPDVLNNKLAWRSTCSIERGYISKIFDIVFEMPSLSKDSLQVMMQEVAEKRQDMYPKACNFMKQSPIRFATPRDIERIVEQWCSTEWLYLAYSEQKEWKDKFSEDTIFLTVALRYFRPNIVDEILEVSPNRYFSLFLSGYVRRINDEWKDRFETTYLDILKNPHIADILVGLSKYVDTKPDWLSAALQGKYAERLLLNLSDIENVLIPKDGDFNARLKEEIQERFKGSVPLLIHKSITRAYSHMVANIEGSARLSNAIRTSLRHEKTNAYRLDMEDSMPFQLTLTFLSRLMYAYASEKKRSVRLNIYASMRSLMIKTSLSQNAEIIRYLSNHKLYSPSSIQNATVFQANVRKEANPALVARLFRCAIASYVFNFCQFMLIRHTSTLTSVRQSGFIIDWRIAYIPRKIVESEGVFRIVNRSVDNFCKLSEIFLHSCVLSSFSYLTTRRITKDESVKRYVITIMDCIVINRIIKNLRQDVLSRLPQNDLEKLKLDMNTVIKLILNGRYAFEDDNSHYGNYSHEPICMKFVSDIQGCLKMIDAIQPH